MHRCTKEAHRVVDLLTDKYRPADILILVETWLWPADRRIIYYKEIQETLFDRHKCREYFINTGALQSKLTSCWDPGNVHGWSDCFSPLLMAEKNPYNKANKKHEYDIWDVKELIRFIRNLYGHHFEFGGDMKSIDKLEDLGESVEDLEFLIRRAFPKLVVELHREVKRQGLHIKAELKPFYE